MNLLTRNILVIVVLGLVEISCTQRVIVFKPSPYVDPIPNFEKKTFEEKPDPKFDEQWNLKQIGVTQDQLGIGLMKGNYNIRVAILSTGLDYNSDELSGQVSINKVNLVKAAAGELWKPVERGQAKNGIGDIVGYDVVDNDGLAYDRHGAGTGIAGIIAARQNNGIGIAGLMKEVTLFPIRYINDNGQTSLHNLVQALEIVIETKPHVVFIQNTQIQLGGRQNDPDLTNIELDFLKDDLTKLHELKIPVVIGSGDDMTEFGSSTIDSLYRQFDNVVVVTASNAQDDLGFLSNFSIGNVHTAAPGESVLSTKPGNQLGYMSGTAVAAAHVTAAIALARSYLGDKAGYDKIIPALISAESSDIVPKLERFSRGGNRLNLPKFLNAIQKL